MSEFVTDNPEIQSETDDPPRPRALRKPRRHGGALGSWWQRINIPGGVGAAVWFVIVGVPLYFLFVSSGRESADYLANGPFSPPTNLSFDNFTTILESDFPLYFLNTFIVTVACVLIVQVLALPAAYAIVRSGKKSVARVFSFVLLGLAVPAQAVIVPLYLLITQVHLYDTLWAIILPTAAFALPLAILVLTSSLRDVPKELYEAINLDGAGSVRALFSLVLPLSRSALAHRHLYGDAGVERVPVPPGAHTGCLCAGDPVGAVGLPGAIRAQRAGHHGGGCIVIAPLVGGLPGGPPVLACGAHRR